MTEEWENINQRTIEDLVSETPERFRLCLQEGGVRWAHSEVRTQYVPSLD
jgi:hypothetical protein